MATSFEIADEARAGVAELLDRQLSPLGLAALEALTPRIGETILDVGCGAGQTLIQLAERVGPTGRITGVDIGAQSLAVAAARTAHLPQVTLLEGDAATLDWPDGCLDGIYSRFGVMFFDDPVVAFSNFRRMIRRGGRISFVCWRSWRENELDDLPVQAAGLEAGIDETPFSFEQPDVLTDILRSAGFGDINIRKFDASVSSGGVDAMLRVVTTVGALGKILRETPALRADAEPRVRAALSARQTGPQLSLNAATWIATARVG